MPATMAASDWLSHNELKIIKGVFAAPGDANTVEPTIQTLNLIDNNSGVALTADGWMPGLPSIEGSGVWQDSPLDVGRRPLILQESNVTEKMQLNITGSSFSDVTKKMMLFTRMALDCRAFWTDNAQINPVYLKWWASCGAGPQYALLYNMEVDFQYMNSPMPAILATVTLEREPYWRWIPPGANPKQWRYEFYSQRYDSSTVSPAPTSLGAFTDQLIYEPTLNNMSEFGASYAALLSNNCITVPATSIPGDAPALFEFYLDTGTSTRCNFLMGKKTAKIPSFAFPATGTIIQNATLNAPDGVLGTDATLVNDTGSVLAQGAVNRQRVEVSFATATNQLRWTAPLIPARSNRFVGRWMVFLRCRQNGGTLGDITMYLRVTEGATMTDTDGVKLNVVNPTVTGGGGASTDWGLTYMGVLSFPFNTPKASVNGGAATGAGRGYGLDQSGLDSLRFGLFALRSAGVGVLYLCDLVLIPIDEGSIQLEAQDSTTGQHHTYDNTGYFTHGSDDTFVNNTTPFGSRKLDKFTGTGITLTPGVENKLYFVTYSGSSSPLSRVVDAGVTIAFYGNIVPRSRGIRDATNILG